MDGQGLGQRLGGDDVHRFVVLDAADDEAALALGAVLEEDLGPALALEPDEAEDGQRPGRLGLEREHARALVKVGGPDADGLPKEMLDRERRLDGARAADRPLAGGCEERIRERDRG